MAIFAPGLALAAAQPQTEFTTKSTVPSFLSSTSETSSGLDNPSKPKSVRSRAIGVVNSIGYMFTFYFYYQTKQQQVQECLQLFVF
jgi:hypothetical protein